MRTHCRSLALALSCALAAACGKDNGNPAPPDAGASAYGLALIGDAVLTLHPGDVRKLQVVLVQAEVGPVAGGKIHLEIADGDPAGATLDATEFTTASGAADGGAGAGVASFTLTAGAKTQFKIVASSPDHTGIAAVAFSINVVPIKRLLQIVGSPQVHVSTDGESAAVTMYISSSVGLKARLLDQVTGLPIAGETLVFSAGPNAKLSFSNAAKTATAVTSAAGDAQVFIISTNVTETGVQITAQTQAGGVGAVTYTVTVNSNNTSTSCTSSQQCPAGQICDPTTNTCTAPGTGGGTCGAGSDHPCPFGYECVNGQCVPPVNPSCDINNPNCPAGQSCQCTATPSGQVCQCKDICPTCTAGTHCNPTTGTCVPDTSPTPDVTGVWYTQHDYSLVQALPNILQQFAKIVAILDQLINGNFFTGALQWLNAIVKAIIHQYVPAWVITVIQILDDIGTIFSNLRSEGAMRVTAGIDATHVKATEVWTSLVFYFLPLCPNGRPAGDPTLPPDCARFDVATSDSTNPGEVGQCKGQSVPAISVQVAPFTASLAGTGTPAGAPWTLTFDPRQVKVKMGRVILVAINLLIQYLTEYNCIEEALDCKPGNPCLIDCQALGVTVSNALGGIISPTVITDICYPLVTQAGVLITNLLAGISFSSDVLDFKGHATVSKYTAATDPNYDPSSCDSGTMCAGLLGNDKWDYNLIKTPALRDGWWEGSFFSILKGMPGAFEATRQPITH